ncbi:MAG: hypothetical protein L6R37_007490 [Teloschistes peruensis]|nr:MAG: hypothetical protein L6R37_007490 [Teloschistes peruensis]
MAEKSSTAQNSFSSGSHLWSEKKKDSVLEVDATSRDRLNAVFENPLAGVPDEQLMQDVEKFCNDNDTTAEIDDMEKGALLSKYPHGVNTADYLSEAEREAVIREKTHKMRACSDSWGAGDAVAGLDRFWDYGMFA